MLNELREIRKRLEAASEEWVPGGLDLFSDDEAWMWVIDLKRLGAANGIVLIESKLTLEESNKDEQGRADYIFIANARRDIATLLNLIDEYEMLINITK